MGRNKNQITCCAKAIENNPHLRNKTYYMQKALEKKANAFQYDTRSNISKMKKKYGADVMFLSSSAPAS